MTETAQNKKRRRCRNCRQYESFGGFNDKGLCPDCAALTSIKYAADYDSSELATWATDRLDEIWNTANNRLAERQSVGQ